jgi:hypothetical protein
MCLLAIQYQLVPEAPVLVAANREEYYDRKSQGPTIQSGKPRVLGGVDLVAGGTWLGVNQHGMLVACCNRRKLYPPMAPLSRGVLCRELLKSSSAMEAAEKGAAELAAGQYDGVNYVCVDSRSGHIVHGGDQVEVVDLQEGLSIIANRNVNDPKDDRVALAKRLLTLQQLDSPVKFLAVASKVFARSPSPPGRPSIILRGKDKGTVSSTLISLGAKPRDAIYQYAPGAPDQYKYEDYSPLLRDILSRGLREARQKAANSQSE